MNQPLSSETRQDRGFFKRLKSRKRVGSVFQSLTFLSVLVGLLALGALLVNVLSNGRLIEAMHAFVQTQQVTLSLRAVTQGADVTTYIQVAKTLYDKKSAQPPDRRRYALDTGDVLIAFLGTPLSRSGDLWRRMQAASDQQLGAAELRWIPRLKRLFGKLSSQRGEDGRFVQVGEILPGSPAERSGLQAGDIIRAVGGRTVERSSQVFEEILLEKLNDPSLAPVSLLVERHGNTQTYALQAVATTTDRYNRNLLGSLWYFLSNFDSRYPEIAGMASAVFGSLYIILLTALFSFPIGIGAAIYLEEYAAKGRLSNFISVNIANLAGVPSVVYGIIGLEIFARGAILSDVAALFGFPEFQGLGRSILAGSLTLTLLVLPIVIINAREALKAVPHSMREAAYGLGASRWQVVRHHVLPYALPGVFTGVILAMSRAIGESAPLLLLGAFLYVPFVPDSVFDVFTVMPLQIFSWTNQPQDGYPNLAAAAILVLLGAMLLLNAVAIVLRNRFQMRW